jgi:hypothetical protein
MSRYRVIQWATGYVGAEAIKGVVARPDMDLVGCYVYDPGKVGQDAGTLAAIAPIGVAATNSVDEICAIDADAVVYSPMMANDGDLIRLLESGKNVVTPCGWVYPRRDGRTAEIEAACARGGATLHGTGIHPGGITERFPLMASALCRDIRHVRMEEFSDIRNYGTASVVREIMLFGQPPDVAARSPMLKVLANGFLQSIDMVADALGFRLDEKKRTTHEMAVATREIATPSGPIAAGTVAAQRFCWQGTVDDEPVITVRVNWLMGDGHLDPDWRLGEQRFEVELDADPPVALTFHGLHPPVVGEHPEIGLVAPAMHCVNAIPAVVAAAPGIATYIDLPLLHGAATSSRQR